MSTFLHILFHKNNETKITSDIKVNESDISLVSSDSDVIESDNISAEEKPNLSTINMKNGFIEENRLNLIDIYIDDASVSRIHARIQKEENEYYLCDMNSTNGTYLNGRRLGIQEKVPIHVSDEITFAGLGYYVGNC